VAHFNLPRDRCADKSDEKTTKDPTIFSLRELAKKAEYGGRWQNWSCIWPTEETVKHGTPYWRHIKAGDTYNAVNLAIVMSKSVYINMDSKKGDIGEYYQDDRPQAQMAPTAAKAYEILKDESNEGRTPIYYFELLGHSTRDALGIGQVDGNSKSLFRPGGYNPNAPSPTFARASKQKGPHRCWFTRNASGFGLTCYGYGFGKEFAKTFLRQGANIKTTSRNTVLRAVKEPFFRNDWEFVREKRGGKRKETYDNIDEILGSTGWANIFGKL